MTDLTVEDIERPTQREVDDRMRQILRLQLLRVTNPFQYQREIKRRSEDHPNE